MDTDKLNKWLTLFANIGVLLGIVFLAVEIRQNTLMVRSEITKDMFVTGSTRMLDIASDPALRKAAAKWSGSTEENLTEMFVLVSIMREFEIAFILRSEGLLDPAVVHSYDSGVPFWLGSQDARDSWNAQKDAYNEDFVMHIDGILSELAEE